MPPNLDSSVRSRIRSVFAVCDYLVFAIGGLCISLLILPAALFGLRVARRWGSFLLHYGWKFMCTLLHVTRNLDLETTDRDRLQKLRGSVIVANHPSLIDVVILVSIIPRTLPLAKASLRRWVFLRPILNSICLVNDGDTATLCRHAEEALRNGYNVLIFPEGTRTTPGKAATLHRGAARIAVDVGAPIHPVRIDTDQPFLIKEYPWWYAGVRCPVFKLTLKEAIHPEPGAEPKSLQVRHLTRRLADALEIPPPQGSDKGTPKEVLI